MKNDRNLILSLSLWSVILRLKRKKFRLTPLSGQNGQNNSLHKIRNRLIKNSSRYWWGNGVNAV